MYDNAEDARDIFIEKFAKNIEAILERVNSEKVLAENMYVVAGDHSWRPRLILT